MRLVTSTKMFLSYLKVNTDVWGKCSPSRSRPDTQGIIVLIHILYFHNKAKSGTSYLDFSSLVRSSLFTLFSVSLISCFTLSLSFTFVFCNSLSYTFSSRCCCGTCIFHLSSQFNPLLPFLITSLPSFFMYIQVLNCQLIFKQFILIGMISILLHFILPRVAIHVYSFRLSSHEETVA